MYLKHWIAMCFLWSQDIKGNDVDLSIYKGKVLLIVNVASQWYRAPFYSTVWWCQLFSLFSFCSFFSVWLLWGSFKKIFYMHCWGSWWSLWGTHHWLLVTAIHDAVRWPDTLHLTFKKLWLHSLFLSCLFKFGGTDTTFFGYLTCFCGVLICTCNESFYTDIGFQ